MHISGGGVESKCSGSLIRYQNPTRLAVLTAAHCFKDIFKDDSSGKLTVLPGAFVDVIVRFGGSKYANINILVLTPGQVAVETYLIVHEHYKSYLLKVIKGINTTKDDENSFLYDLAVFRLPGTCRKKG